MSNAHLVCVWNTQKTCVPAFSWNNGGSRALFMGPVTIFFRKNDFKTRSHGTIHTFKNYFVTVFSVFSNKRYPNKPLAFVWIVLKSTCICVSHFFIFEKSVSRALWVPCRNIKQNYVFPVGPVHCSWDPQVLYLENETKKKNFKTGFHSTIHTFKNYFVTVFSVFSKISGIQINPQYSFGMSWNFQFICNFNLFLLLFMNLIVLLSLFFNFFFYIFNKKISILAK